MSILSSQNINHSSIADEIVLKISSHQLSADLINLNQVSLFLTQAIFLEVCTHPKPGLVTRKSNGAHKDMSIFTFAVSSAVLARAFYELQIMGMKHEGDCQSLLEKVRKYGINAERELLQVTKGVNTQRGILFAGGILCAAAGYALKNELFSDENVYKIIQNMTAGIVKKELENLTGKKQMTAGECLYLEHGVTGIRGEVEKGLPSVRFVGLPSLKKAFEKKLSLNDALLHTLISLMTVVEDSNVIWRGGYARLAFVQQRAHKILEVGSVYTTQGQDLIRELECEFEAERISPGGSADLLSITIALYLLENKEFPVDII